MELHLPFSTAVERIAVPDSLPADRIGRTAGDDTPAEDILRRALASPLQSSSLADFCRAAADLLVVINDTTRSTPTGLILAAIQEILPPPERVHIIVATGLHRAPTEEEYQLLLGDAYDRWRGRTIAHDGWAVDELVEVDGGSSPVLVHPALKAARHILVITSVEPHFFAGYTGGRKSFLPGLAGYPSVEESHAHAVSEEAQPLRIAGNPVREFISGNTDFLRGKAIFSIQVVLDRFDKIVFAAAGDVDESFTAACVAARSFYTMSVSRRYDIVVALVRPPLDLNLYQTEKAWEHARYAVNQGGIALCASACPQGIGSRFYERLISAYPDQSQWLQLADQPYEMGAHKLVRTARMRAHAELWLVSTLEHNLVRQYGYEPKESLQSAMTEAVALKGDDATTLIIDDAALTVPILENK